MTLASYQHVLLLQKVFYDLQILLITFCFALYDFLQFPFQVIVSGLPFKRVCKAALLWQFKVFPMIIRSICFVVYNNFPSPNCYFCFFFPDGMKNLSANSPENYPSNLIQQPLDLFSSEDNPNSRAFTSNQNCSLYSVKTHCKMFTTPKTLMQANYPLTKSFIAETIFDSF